MRLTVREVADRLGITPDAVRKLIRAGRLPAAREDTPRGPVFYVEATDLDAFTRRAPGRPKRLIGMTREDIIKLVREHGPQDVAAMVDNPIAVGIREGWDLTQWRVSSVAGAILLFRVEAALAAESAAAADRLRQEKRDLEKATQNPARYHVPEAQAAADRAQSRINGIDGELRELRQAGETGAGSPALEGILCVNAAESERATYEALLPEFPVTVLMRGEW